MSGDLEDFLRRAAERRKQKAAQSPPPQQPQRQSRPQYSDKRTERVVRQEEEILTAELVEEYEHPESLATRQRLVDEARRRAAEAAAKAAAKKAAAEKQSRQATQSQSPSVQRQTLTSDDMTSQLVQLLQSPNGVKQAILLREILDRPEHRW